MATEITLCTKHDEFVRLHLLTESKKTTITVDKELLEKLLTDHSIMSKAIAGSASFRLIEPSPRERVKLKGK